MTRIILSGTYSNGGREWRFEVSLHPAVRAGLMEWIRHTIRAGGSSIKAGGALRMNVQEITKTP